MSELASLADPRGLQLSMGDVLFGQDWQRQPRRNAAHVHDPSQLVPNRTRR